MHDLELAPHVEALLMGNCDHSPCCLMSWDFGGYDEHDCQPWHAAVHVTCLTCMARPSVSCRLVSSSMYACA